MSETLGLDQIILAGVDSRLFDLHTCLPAVVEKFNKAKNTVDARPSIKRKYESGEVVSLPIILNIPVQFPRGSNFSISYPIKKGDSVLLIFAERSLDIWKKNGGIVDPKDPRRFNITDAFAIPGGYPENNPITDISETSVRIKNKDSLIDISEDGKFKIQKIGGDDFLKLMSDTLQAILDARTMTSMGPQPFLNLAAFSALKTKLDAIKGQS